MSIHIILDQTGSMNYHMITNHWPAKLRDSKVLLPEALNSHSSINPLPYDILDASKLKEFEDDNFKFDENGRKLSKWVENTVFSKDFYSRHVKTRACLGKG